ncbi:MAG TPA: DEAD/DEAH box helicase, partial [Acidocella sp.]|nr:DEAD/DEAH box helicase [Acidocella sp.]
MPFPITNPALARALAARGYNDPTDVQLAVLAPEALDRDLLVSAQTGSGKTVAFGLALASTILGDAERLPATVLPLVLVIALVAAMAVCGTLKYLIERLAYRRLRNAPKLAPLVTAIGMSIFLETMAMVV